MEARKLDEQIKKHFSHQRAENNRMQADQNELKGDMTAIHQALIAAQKKLNDEELQIGIDMRNVEQT